MIVKTVDIKVEQGVLRGEIQGKQMIFRGIPYAKAPINEFRFKSPQALSRWIGVREALTFKAICPQITTNNVPQSEDCLYLNIWAPSDYQKKKYPVVFWIHGGSFSSGYGHEALFNGKNYVSRETILVTINYRLGIFGFLATPEMTRADSLHAVSNLGLLDMIYALRWVYRNIEAFGGDADRITIMGQEYAAIACQALLASSLTRGMIYAAILQSGAGLNDGIKRSLTKDEAYQRCKDIMTFLNVHKIDELGSIPTQKILSIYGELYKKYGRDLFLPAVDHLIIEKNLEELWQKQEVANVPIIIGKMTDDLKQSDYQGILNLIQTRSQQSPIYMYLFSKKLADNELLFTFGALERSEKQWSFRDYRLEAMIMDQWTNFIKKGNPGNAWKAYQKENPFIRIIV